MLPAISLESCVLYWELSIWYKQNTRENMRQDHPNACWTTFQLRTELKCNRSSDQRSYGYGYMELMNQIPPRLCAVNILIVQNLTRLRGQHRKQKRLSRSIITFHVYRQTTTKKNKSKTSIERFIGNRICSTIIYLKCLHIYYITILDWCKYFVKAIPSQGVNNPQITRISN